MHIEEQALGKAVHMAQVSIIGGGNVGANAGFFIAEKGVTDVLLVDIQPGLSRGKMLDIMEAAPIRRYRNFLSGSDSLKDIKGSEFVVVAAGDTPFVAFLAPPPTVVAPSIASVGTPLSA